MAGHPKDRLGSHTDSALLAQAGRVRLMPPLDRAVFYADDEGAVAAARLVSTGQGFMRLDDLLQQSVEGRELWRALTVQNRQWASKEEVWWELSWRLARAAKGVVNVFGPARFVEDRPLAEYRHRHTTAAHANTVFEKVELPELEQNPRVTEIYFNGRLLS
ncbi:MAG: hypothetical protein EOP24_47950 [Hyphomicrobiales bacterium]|nr:MAG: hypothetical protein EOP24_47950 [Hyphomicrobiales bacterium]